jgi:hypothetical protein
VWNSDFLALFPCVTGRDMCELEMQFLQLLQFNVNVASPLFTKYYYELRALSTPLIFLPPLTVHDRWKVDAMSMATLEKNTPTPAQAPVQSNNTPAPVQSNNTPAQAQTHTEAPANAPSHAPESRPRTHSFSGRGVRNFAQPNALLIVS